MDVSDSFSGDELIPESCLESEWIDEDEVFAILKQWETRGGGVGGNSNNKPASANSWANNNSSGGNTLINQSFGSDASVSLKQDKLASECDNRSYYDQKRLIFDESDNTLGLKEQLLAPNGSSKYCLYTPESHYSSSTSFIAIREYPIW